MAEQTISPRVERFHSNPYITPATSATMGENISGPSGIRVPDWLSSPLGRYYMYFTHHEGIYIRLAYADHLRDDWNTWQTNMPAETIKPELEHEGIQYPIKPSPYEAAVRTQQLRDPYVLIDNNLLAIFYICPGEEGICGVGVILNM